MKLFFRLLSQGADPNYYHPEKNSTPLQVKVQNMSNLFMKI